MGLQDDRRRRSRRTRASSAIGVPLLAAFALVACGGDEPASPAPTAADVLSIVTATPGLPPPRAATPAPVVGQQRYVVREGDSLSVIAERFGVTQEAIQRANGLAEPNSLFAGQELIIPAPEP